MGLLIIQLFEKAEKVSSACACVWLGVSRAMTAAVVHKCAHGWWGQCCAGAKAVPLRAGCREMSLTGCPSLWGKERRGPWEEWLPALLSPGGDCSLQGHFEGTQGLGMACSWSRSMVVPPCLLWPPWATLFSPSPSLRSWSTTS